MTIYTLITYNRDDATIEHLEHFSEMPSATMLDDMAKSGVIYDVLVGDLDGGDTRIIVTARY